MTPLVATAHRELRTAIPNSVFYAVIAWLLAAQSVLAAETHTVLVLYSNNRLVPGNVDVDRGLRAALTNTSERAVVTYSEFLDEPDFGGPEYEANVARYLREKYSTRRPDAIVGVSNEAFDFPAASPRRSVPRHSVGPRSRGDHLPPVDPATAPPML